jgi:hypothetical protein
MQENFAMKRFLGVVALLVSVAGAALAQTPGRVEQKFAPGGRIKLELGGGDYDVRAGADDKIVVSYTTGADDDMKHVDARVSAFTGAAKVQVHGPHTNFHATIEVPAHSDLNLRLLAGDIRITGIEGNKDLMSHAGDMTVDVGRADDYGTVAASINAGDLNAPAFRVSKGGLFRSFSHHGTGKYTLRAHLGAGDLTLR